MKRFTILFTIVGLLAFWAVVHTWSDARAEAKKTSAPAPVYDSTGAMLEALNPDKEVITLPAYDATGTMLDAINP